VEIQHDEENKIFYIEIAGERSDLKYRFEGDTTINAYSTFTPPEQRGQGLAGKVTQAALDWAKTKSYKVIPGCPYVAAYIKRHPEYEELL
jgi:predicted GNAT family acetyltransferase